MPRGIRMIIKICYTIWLALIGLILAGCVRPSSEETLFRVNGCMASREPHNCMLKRVGYLYDGLTESEKHEYTARQLFATNPLNGSGGHRSKAEDEINKAIQLDPYNTGAYSLRAKIFEVMADEYGEIAGEYANRLSDSSPCWNYLEYESFKTIDLNCGQYYRYENLREEAIRSAIRDYSRIIELILGGPHHLDNEGAKIVYRYQWKGLSAGW
jgi:hypothetical protein